MANFISQFSKMVSRDRGYRSAKSAYDKAAKKKSAAYKKAVAKAKRKMKSKRKRK